MGFAREPGFKKLRKELGNSHTGRLELASLTLNNDEVHYFPCMHNTDIHESIKYYRFLQVPLDLLYVMYVRVLNRT
jgi:hypothetical protein